MDTRKNTNQVSILRPPVPSCLNQSAYHPLLAFVCLDAIKHQKTVYAAYMHAYTNNT